MHTSDRRRPRSTQRLADHVETTIGTELSAESISKATDAIAEEVRA